MASKQSTDRRAERPDYKPCSLTFLFLGGLISALSVALALTVWAYVALPTAESVAQASRDGSGKTTEPETRPSRDHSQTHKPRADSTNTPTTNEWSDRSANFITKPHASHPYFRPVLSAYAPKIVTINLGHKGRLNSEIYTAGVISSEHSEDVEPSPRPVTTSGTAAEAPAEMNPVTVATQAATTGAIRAATVEADSPSRPTDPLPMVLVTSVLSIVTGTDGNPIATVAQYSRVTGAGPVFLTVAGSHGNPQTTLATYVTGTGPIAVLVTLSNADGVPTETRAVTIKPETTSPPGKPSSPPPEEDVYTLSGAHYFAVFFLPTLLSVAISNVITVIDANARFYMPFYTLARPQPVSGQVSLCLRTSSLYARVDSVRAMFSAGTPLGVLTAVLVAFSALATSFSGEAFPLRYLESCKSLGHDHCIMSPTVSRAPARAVIGSTCGMIITASLLMYALHGRPSGVAADPRSIAGIGSLISDTKLLELLRTLRPCDGRTHIQHKQLMLTMGRRTFRSSIHVSNDDTSPRGITLAPCAETDAVQPPLETPPTFHRGARNKDKACEPHKIPFNVLRAPYRVAILALLSSMLAVVVYYNATVGDSPFERFMDSSSFGVRFLFAGVGVILSFYWDAFSSCECRQSNRLYRYRWLC